jgi:hypothetical protein
MTEIWRPFSGYEHQYFISNFGRVKSVNYRGHGKEMILKLSLTPTGYVSARLYKKGALRPTRASVHRAVAAAFCKKVEGKNIVAHVNGIKTDNRAKNLIWATNEENSSHKYLHGTAPFGEKHSSAKLSNKQRLELVTKYFDDPSFGAKSALAREYGINNSTVARIINYAEVWGYKCA